MNDNDFFTGMAKMQAQAMSQALEGQIHFVREVLNLIPVPHRAATITSFLALGETLANCSTHVCVGVCNVLVAYAPSCGPAIAEKIKSA